MTTATPAPSRTSSPEPITLAFIGGGNMARGLIGGLLAQGHAAAQMTVSDPAASAGADLARLFPGIGTTTDNTVAAAAARVWILAVKPQEMPGVARALGALATRQRPLVISVAAGIQAADLARWLGDGAAIVRAMPNRPAFVGAGMTGLYAAPGVDAASRDTAARILAAVGATVWVERESDMDSVTALSGSGPAYFFLLMELLSDAGRQLGLTPEVAQTLAIETAWGAAKLAREGTDDPATLRAQVTSKGGTTAAALAVFEAAGLRDIVSRAVAAAAERSAELARDFGRD